MASKGKVTKARRSEAEAESEWVRRAIGGDTEAFGRLVEHYQDRVYHFAFRLTGNRDRAWDLSQEAFMRAFAAMSRFKGESGFFTWMYRITLNLHINQVSTLKGRMEKRAYSLDLPRGDDDGSPMKNDLSGPKALDPTREASVRERAVLVQQAIDELPPDYKQAILLRDMEGFSYEEMADLLSIPIGTVRSRIHRGRDELKKRLKGLDR